MTSITVRPVRPGDAAAWLEMRTALWPDEPGDHPPEIAAYFDDPPPDAPVLIAVVDERAVGFAELSTRTFAEGCTTRPVAYLEGWFVRETARRAGVGRALIDAAEAWARSRGLREFASDAEIDNEPSRAAHARLGFAEVAVVRCFRKPLDPS